MMVRMFSIAAAFLLLQLSGYASAPRIAPMSETERSSVQIKALQQYSQAELNALYSQGETPYIPSGVSRGTAI